MPARSPKGAQGSTKAPGPKALQSSTAQSSTAQSSTAQSSTAQSSTAQSSTAQSSTAQSSTAQSSTAQSHSPPSRSKAQGSAPEDVVLLTGRTDDGQGLRVLRKRGDELSAGEVRPLAEGKPIAGELVTLRPRPGAPIVFDVESHYRPEPPKANEQAKATAGARTKQGPARVSDDEYRKGWSVIWGKRRRELPN